MDISQHLQRKFLVVVDGTPEAHAALRFAARRAHGTQTAHFCRLIYFLAILLKYQAAYLLIERIKEKLKVK